MTIPGLTDVSVRQLADAIGFSDDGDDRDAIITSEDLVARACWSGIAEPGDRVAHALIGAVGAAGALDIVVDSRTADHIVERLRERGIDGAKALTLADVRGAITRWRPKLSLTRALATVRAARHLGAQFIVPGGALWPRALDDLEVHAPVGLWVRGNPTRLGALKRSIALVGARAASGYGEHVATEAASRLASRNIAIVSGAAYGIDGAAHRATLSEGGITAAFLAGGIDRFYPSGHSALLSHIVDRGIVLSELAVGAAPTRWRFLQRNRLIAAATRATVVLEAGHRSGSLNTAGHAAALARPLGAVPGSVTSPGSAGCHRLLREYDAICVTNATEMAELIGDTPRDPSVALATSSHCAASRVVEALQIRRARRDHDIADRSGLSIEAVRAELGILNALGVVEEVQSGWKRLPQKPPVSPTGVT